MLKGTHLRRVNAYWRCSVRVSVLIIAHLERIAVREHWTLSDLARMLICLGAAGSYLRLGDPEVSDRFKTLARVGGALNAFSATLGETSRRPYTSPGVVRSELVALHLPTGLTSVITAYARTSGRSRNEVLVMFLEPGLIIYLKGEKILQETIQSLNTEPVKTTKPDETVSCL